jgi:hypothetical protein
VESQKLSRDEALLVSVAESVGSTLGTLAAKANAFQRALTPGAKRKRRTAKSAAKHTARKRKPATRKRTSRARSKS